MRTLDLRLHQSSSSTFLDRPSSLLPLSYNSQSVSAELKIYNSQEQARIPFLKQSKWQTSVICSQLAKKPSSNAAFLKSCKNYYIFYPIIAKFKISYFDYFTWSIKRAHRFGEPQDLGLNPGLSWWFPLLRMRKNMKTYLSKIWSVTKRYDWNKKLTLAVVDWAILDTKKYCLWGKNN